MVSALKSGHVVNTSIDVDFLVKNIICLFKKKMFYYSLSVYGEASCCSRLEFRCN